MPIAIATIAYAIVLFMPQVLNDGDTWSHIAIGRWIVQHRGVPWADPFSFSFAGKPWIAQEWLSELAMAVDYRLGELDGVLILSGAAVALAIGLFAWHLRLWLEPLPALIVLIFGAACIAPSLLARPHILALPALELWTAGLLIARSRNGAPSPWLLPVMVLWANLHGSFAFGLALVVPLGLEAVLSSPAARWQAARAWSLFLAAAIAASLITPYGWHGLILPVQLLRLTHLGNIGEWRSLDFSTPPPLEIALMALLYVCLSRGVRIPLVRLFLLMGLLHMALRHTRHQMLAGVVGALVLAEPLAHAVNQRIRGGDPNRGGLGRGTAAWTFAGLCLVAGLTAIRLANPAVPRDGFSSPVSALAQVPAALKAQPVFNDYAFGGMLMFDGIRPFIDARAELYGDDFLAFYLDMIRPDRAALETALRDYAITWTILTPQSPAVAVLDSLPGWRRVYTDRFAVVHTSVEPAR